MPPLGAERGVSRSSDYGSERPERHRRQTRDETEEDEKKARHGQNPGRGKELFRQVGAEIAVGCRPGDDNAGRRRDEQRGNLRDQAVAHGKQRVAGGGLFHGEAPLEHSYGETAQMSIRTMKMAAIAALHELRWHRPSRRRNRPHAALRAAFGAPYPRRSGPRSSRRRCSSACPALHRA